MDPAVRTEKDRTNHRAAKIIHSIACSLQRIAFWMVHSLIICSECRLIPTESPPIESGEGSSYHNIANGQSLSLPVWEVRRMDGLPNDETRNHYSISTGYWEGGQGEGNILGTLHCIASEPWEWQQSISRDTAQKSQRTKSIAPKISEVAHFISKNGSITSVLSFGLSSDRRLQQMKFVKHTFDTQQEQPT